MSVRRIIPCLLALFLALVLAGCGGDSNLNSGPETDDPSYRDGEAFKKQGRTQEALAAYLKVIEKRGDQGAPESHLEVGLIFKQHLKDSLEAIHHFRKYLELKPNSPLAPSVRAQMEDAKREYARTLAANPLESQAARLDAFDKIDSLRQENDQLKAEIASLRGGASVARPTNSVHVALGEPAEAKMMPVSVPPADESSPITLAPMTPRDTEAPVVQSAPSSGPAAATPTRPPLSKPTAPAKSPPPAGGGRNYTVGPHEGLWGIATKVYGTASTARVNGIVEANRGVLPNGIKTSLTPGMVLKIP